jgi:hypothetical protein
MANVEGKVPARDRVWWRSPRLLGYGALGACALLTIAFW